MFDFMRITPTQRAADDARKNFEGTKAKFDAGYGEAARQLLLYNDYKAMLFYPYEIVGKYVKEFEGMVPNTLDVDKVLLAQDIPIADPYDRYGDPYLAGVQRGVRDILQLLIRAERQICDEKFRNLKEEFHHSNSEMVLKPWYKRLL